MELLVVNRVAGVGVAEPLRGLAQRLASNLEVPLHLGILHRGPGAPGDVGACRAAAMTSPSARMLHRLHPNRAARPG